MLFNGFLALLCLYNLLTDLLPALLTDRLTDLTRYRFAMLFKCFQCSSMVLYNLLTDLLTDLLTNLLTYLLTELMVYMDP